jgi:ubiquinone biosynthesis protein COQ4
MVDGSAPIAPTRVDLPTGRRQWGVALRALKRLLADTEDTAQVFEIMRALNGRVNTHGYRRLLKTAQGGRIAYDRVELAPLLANAAWLDRFEPDTVGGAYRAFMRAQNLSATGLADISNRQIVALEMRHPHFWYARRTRDVHDLWHVLSGYGRDALGEACLVAFSFAQAGGLGWALIAIGAAFRAWPGKQPYLRAIWEAYLRGRSAAWLPGEDYEALLSEPLEAARARLALRPPRIYDSIPSDLRG